MSAVRSAQRVRPLTFFGALLLTTAFTVPAFAQIETVVVTAERRAENLQKIPVAVTAFTSKDRDKIGINSIQDMASFTPGMTYSTSTDRVTLRGISRQTNVLSADSGVANYDDGIYQSFAVAAGRSSLDLDRVEVVRGPQSTLYGRNSIGGAINQVTARPQDTFAAEVRASYENYDHSVLEGSVTGPIDDNWKYRFYGDWERQGLGWAKNVLGGPEEGGVINTWYLEGQLSGNITPDLETYTRFYTTHWDNGAGGPGAASGGWTPADFPTFEEGQGSLVLNPGYGCTIYNSQPLTPVSNPTYPNAGSNTTVISATSPAGNAPPGTGTPCQNPSVNTPWKINRLVPYTDSVPGAYFGTTQWTWHSGNDFDVKFIDGTEWYRYVLTGPNKQSGNYDAPISAYTIGTNFPQTIPLFLATGGLVGGPCAITLANPTGICPPATIFPQQAFNYQQQEFFTQNEITIDSTGDSPLQWIGGLYSFIQHESQPVSATDPGQAQLSAPANAVAEPAAFNDPPHAPIGNRWFDDRIQFNDISLAVFGQVSYKFTDELKATAGLRYSKDRKYGVEQSRLVEYGLAAVVPPEFTGAATPAFDLTPPALGIVDYFSGNSGPCEDAAGAPTPPTPDTGVTQCAQYNASSGFAVRRYNHASDAITGSFKLEFTPDDTTETYASYSRGYKGGGYNTGIFSFINPKPWVGPEHVDALEVGAKKTWTDWMGDNTSIVLDVAAFYYNYEDMQVPLGVAATPGGVNSIEFLSIPRAVSEGFEAEAFVTPFEHLTAIASYSFDEAHIMSSTVPGIGGAPQGVSDPQDPNALVPGAQPLFTPAQCLATPGLCGTDIYTLGTNPDPKCAPQATCGWVIPQSLKGNRLPNSPLNKVALNVQYDWQIPEIGTFTPSVTWRWQGSQFGTVFSRFYNMAPSWDQWDARVSFASPDSHWTFIVYGRNLANKIGYDTGATAARYAGTIDRSCSGAPIVGGGFLDSGANPGPAVPSQAPCNFVQGETAGAATPTPPGYGAVRGESPYGTVSTYSVTPPLTYGAQLQYKF